LQIYIKLQRTTKNGKNGKIRTQAKILESFATRTKSSRIFSFFCTKPLDQTAHDRWITRLRTAVKDCEFDKMDDDEAIKLVVTLHTTSEKLQTAIIQKDMYLNKVIEAAKSMEMAQREVKFIKNNTLKQSTNEHSLDALTKY